MVESAGELSVVVVAGADRRVRDRGARWFRGGWADRGISDTCPTIHQVKRRRQPHGLNTQAVHSLSPRSPERAVAPRANVADLQVHVEYLN